MFKYLLISILSASSLSAQDLFKHTHLQYEGLTEYGVSELKIARDAIRQRFTLFEQEFKGLSNLHHMATLARILKANPVCNFFSLA